MDFVTAPLQINTFMIHKESCNIKWIGRISQVLILRSRGFVSSEELSPSCADDSVFIVSKLSFVLSNQLTCQILWPHQTFLGNEIQLLNCFQSRNYFIPLLTQVAHKQSNLI